MSSERNFPPSEYKLERLRQSGVFARSRFFAESGKVLGVLLGVIVVVGIGKSRIQQFAIGSWSVGETNGKFLDSILQTFGAIIIPFFVVSAFFVLLAGFSQSGFLFTFRLFDFDLGRLFSGFSKQTSGFWARFLGGIVGVLHLFAMFAIAYLLLKFIPETALLLNQEIESSWNEVLSISSAKWHRAIFVVSIFLFVTIVLARLFSVALFRKRQAMSRAEVEAENREL